MLLYEDLLLVMLNEMVLYNEITADACDLIISSPRVEKHKTEKPKLT